MIYTLGRPRVTNAICGLKPGRLGVSRAFWGDVGARELLLIKHPSTPTGRFELVESPNRQTIKADAVLAWRPLCE
jgi:hypothetical protein